MIANALRLAQIHPVFTAALVLAVLLALALAIFALRRRTARGAPELAALAVAVAWWSVAQFLEIALPTLRGKLLALGMQKLCLSALPALWTLLAVRVTGLLSVPRALHLALVVPVPIATTAFAFAFPRTVLLWTDVQLLESSLPLTTLQASPGPWFWFDAAWSTGLICVAIVLFVVSQRSAPRYYSLRTMALIAAAAAPLVMEGLLVLGLASRLSFSITPVVVVVSAIAVAGALSRGRLLEVAPFARDAVFWTMADPLLVLDRAGRVVDANPAAQALFGAARQLVGASAGDLVPDLPAASSASARVRLGDRRLPAAPERWFEIDLADLADRRGRPTSRVVQLHETTDRRRVEQTLHASEQMFRRLVDSIDQVIFSLDREGRFTYVSPAVERISRWKAADIVGRPLEQFVYPEDLAQVRRNVASRYRGDREPHEFRVLNPDGSTLHVRTYSYPLSDDADDPAGLSGIMTDITGQKELQERLQQGQKMEAIGRLAGGIAHDFSNLLTAITGFSEMLLLDGRVGAESRGWVAEIRRSIDRGSSLVRQLLAFGRKRTPRLRSVDLNDLIRGIQRMLERLIGEHLVLDTVLAAGLPPLCADPGQLELAIVNLAANARDAMPGGGTLSIETSAAPGRGGKWLQLVIGDTGVGMDAHVRSHLFEPFFTTKEQGRGTGLGLSTVYGIVQQCGGTIAVESEPGRGTRVVIDLPAGDTPPECDAEAVEPVAPKGGIERLLVVEDDPLVRTTIQACLAPLGYRLTVAADGAEALATAVDEIDLLVTDVVMPGISGGALAGRLREARPDLPVLFVSGYEPGLLFPDGLPGGRSGFLQKPFTTEDLARAVRALLD